MSIDPSNTCGRGTAITIFALAVAPLDWLAFATAALAADLSTDFVFFNAPIGQLSAVNLANKDLKGATFDITGADGAQILAGTIPSLAPGSGWVQQVTLGASGGSLTYHLPPGFNSCDLLPGFATLRAASSSGSSAIENVVDAALWDTDTVERGGQCGDGAGLSANPNVVGTTGPKAVTAATTLQVALHNTGDAPSMYDVQVSSTVSGQVIESQSVTVSPGNTGVVSFASPFGSVGSVVPVVCAKGNSVSLNLNVLQSVVINGHTQVISQQDPDAEWIRSIPGRLGLAACSGG